jgi:hypothetical protein
MGVTIKSILAAHAAGRKTTAKGAQSVSRFGGWRACVHSL